MDDCYEIEYVNGDRVQRVCKTHLVTGNPPKENRGGNRKEKHFEQRKQSTTQFVENLNATETHYCRSDAPVTPNNVKSGFKCTGIYPFDKLVFSNEDYLPASVTNQPQPAVSINAGEGPAQPNKDILQPATFTNVTECLAQPSEDIEMPIDEIRHIFNGAKTIKPRSPQPSPSSASIVSPDNIRPLPHAKPKQENKKELYMDQHSC
ncbi:hypothetical protein J6590_025142 [Homalodisca vitripennis]|nr:hypothetical protein J6590_025142 [Homalodisca vitripennis]